MRAAAEHVWGSPTVAGRTVGVAGVGKVGRHLVRHLLEDGAAVVVTDVNEEAVARLTAEHPQVEVVADTDALVRADIDIYSPCALGGALSDEVAETLRAKIVCGGANNQLAHPGVEKMLADRGVLYAPDFCVNSGGVIQVADEIEGFVVRARQAQGGRDLRHDAAGVPDRGRRGRSRPSWPPSGWPSGGWPRWAGCGPSPCPGGTGTRCRNTRGACTVRAREKPTDRGARPA